MILTMASTCSALSTQHTLFTVTSMRLLILSSRLPYAVQELLLIPLKNKL